VEIFWKNVYAKLSPLNFHLSFDFQKPEKNKKQKKLLMMSQMKTRGNKVDAHSDEQPKSAKT